MIPTTFIGLALFVALIAPGFLAGVARSRSTPEPQQTPLREIATILFLSLVTWCIVILTFTGVRAVVPGLTPNVGAILRDPHTEFLKYHVSLGWWAFGVLICACAVGYIVGKATITNNAKWIGRFLTPGPVSKHSAWYLTMSENAEYFADSAPPVHGPAGPTVLWCILDDGATIVGDLFSFSPHTPESGDRDIVLSAPISIRPAEAASGFEDQLDSGAVIISSRHIGYFVVHKYMEARKATEETCGEA